MKCYLAFLLICRAHAVLDYNTIKESLKWRTDSGYRINEKGLLNPILGFLLEHNGIVHNMRFFSPSIRTHYLFVESDSNKIFRRLYEKDQPVDCKDSFHRILLTFFPSTEGRVSIFLGRSNTTFLGTLLKNYDRKLAIYMLSVLTAVSLGGKVEYKVTGADCVMIGVAPGLEIREDKMSLAAELMDFFSRENIAADKKAVLLQNFIYHFLNTREEIEEFFNHVYSFMKIGESMCFVSSEETDSGVDYSLLDDVVRTARVLPHIVRAIPKETKLPLYTRVGDSLIGKPQFSFQVEIVLLGLMCNLLYDEKNAKYNAKHLGNSTEHMKDFFAKVESTVPMTGETATYWLRVVEDIRDPSILYSIMVPKCENARNILDPGLINLLMVLKSICGIDWTPGAGWTKDKEMPHSYEEIKDMFEGVYTSTLAKICTKELFCEFKDMSVRKKPNSSSWEVFGTITISIQSKNDIYKVVQVTHTAEDADYMSFVAPFAWCEKNLSHVINKTEECVRSNNTLVSLIGKCVKLHMLYDVLPGFPYDCMAQSLDSESADDLFFQGGIYTDSTKIMLLDILFSHRYKKNKAFHQLERNILASLNLNDELVRDVASLFVLFRRPLAKFAKILPKKWSRRRNSITFQRLVLKRCINLVCYCIDEKETWYHRKMFPVDINECSLYYLITLLIRHDRKSSIERLCEKYKQRMHEIMYSGLKIAVKTSNAEYAHYFFEKIPKSGLEQFEYNVLVQDVSEYLINLASESDISSRMLEKIYCWYFCDSTGMFCMGDLYRVVESTYTRLNIDFIYDCMVKRCPKYYNYMMFHKLFLELAIRDRIVVRNDALVLISLLAESIDMNPYYIVLGCKPIKLSKRNSSEMLKEELLNAIIEVKKRGLVYRVSFDESEYVRFLSEYAVDFADGYGPHKCKKYRQRFGEKYIREIRRIFG